MLLWFSTILGCQFNTRHIEVNIQVEPESVAGDSDFLFSVEWDGEAGFHVRWQPKQD